MTKITKTNFKTFIKKNNGNMLINIKSEFDGQVDGTVDCKRGFTPALKTEKHIENTYGIQGAWLVGGGRNYFETYNEDGKNGIQVSNCCGRFIVAVAE